MALGINLLLLTCFLAGSHGLTAEDLLPFGMDLDTLAPMGSGVYGEALRMSKVLVYNRERFADVYVNTNGFITFTNPRQDPLLQEEYLSQNLSLSNADILAPFYSRVDTSLGGDVYYREAKETHLLEQATLDINRLFRPGRRFIAESLLIVTWSQVSPYSSSDDTNTFQLVMATQQFDSYVTFSYVGDMLQWAQGSAGDLPAQAVLDTRRGNDLVVLPYSGTKDVMELARESNMGVPGRWMFRVGNVRRFHGPVANPDPPVPQPDSDTANESEGEDNSSTTGKEAMEHSCGHTDPNACHEHAECRMQTGGGSCCYCTGYYFGNGKDCFEKGVVLRGYGELTGAIGAEEIPTIPVYTTLQPSTGRTYVAIGTLPLSVAQPLQVLLNIGEVAGFMGALEPGDTKNGLSIMGSNVNYTARVQFQTGEYATVSFTFTGVSANGFQNVAVSVKGTLPQVTSSALTQDPVETGMELTKVSVGRMVGRSQQVATIGGLQYIADVEHIFEYEECAFDTETHPIGSSARVSFTSYEFYYDDSSDRGTILRYSLTASMVDPFAGTCAGVQCPSRSTCVPDDTAGLVCRCEDGFEMSLGQCADINECSQTICKENTVCVNSEGSFRCDCLSGYVQKDFLTCEAVLPPSRGSCEDIVCGANSYCELDREQYPICLCDQGYVTGEDGTCAPVDINNNDCSVRPEICSEFAQCLQDFRREVYECVCKPGYVGDGASCAKALCYRHEQCGAEARCLYSGAHNAYKCMCNPGFVGDGQTCAEEGKPEPVPKTCNDIDECHPDAYCTEDLTEGPTCHCHEGFSGNGNQCTKIDSCFHRPEMCDINASCRRESATVHVCTCNVGFQGSGARCYPIDANGDHMLVSGGVSIFQVPFDVGSSTPAKRVLYRQKDTIIGLAVDCKDRYLFWSDISLHRILRTTLGSSDEADIEVVASDGLISPEGLTVDWIGRNLFWADSGADRIEVSRLDGTSRKVIVSRGLVNPRSIVADPYNGKIYWADWNRRGAKIEGANMDGSGRRVIVSEGLSLPNGLAMDFSREKLCWADAGTHNVECIYTDGTGREVVYASAVYPFSLIIHRDRFYWTDWKIDSIQSIRRNSAELEEPIDFPSGDRQRAFGIVPVLEECPRTGASNPCAYADCRHLCLPLSASDYICACPDDISEEECNQVKKRL